MPSVAWAAEQHPLSPSEAPYKLHTKTPHYSMSSARDNAEAPQGTAAASVSASTHSPGSGLAAALVVFARLPVPGRVKTRLAAGVGADAACTWYQACAHHAIEQAAG